MCEVSTQVARQSVEVLAAGDIIEKVTGIVTENSSDIAIVESIAAVGAGVDGPIPG